MFSSRRTSNENRRKSFQTAKETGRQSCAIDTKTIHQFISDTETVSQFIKL